MIVSAIQCKECKDVIYSRAHHDFHHCSCGNCFVDGGFDYFRYGANSFNSIKEIKLQLDITKTELYDDWNYSRDKYGTIKGN